jgi:hypothetical protein
MRGRDFRRLTTMAGEISPQLLLLTDRQERGRRSLVTLTQPSDYAEQGISAAVFS